MTHHVYLYARQYNENIYQGIIAMTEDAGEIRIFHNEDPESEYQYALTQLSFIRPFRPNYYDIWDLTNGEENGSWIPDQVIFQPLLKEDLSTHRDEKIGEESLVEITFHVGEIDEEVLGLLANPRTLEAVGRKCTVTPIVDVDSTVSYKFKTFTPEDAGDEGYRDVDRAFLQEFAVALDAENQKYFDAEKHVLELNRITNYQTFESARNDFDDYISNH